MGNEPFLCVRISRVALQDHLVWANDHKATLMYSPLEASSGRPENRVSQRAFKCEYGVQTSISRCEVSNILIKKSPEADEGIASLHRCVTTTPPLASICFYLDLDHSLQIPRKDQTRHYSRMQLFNFWTRRLFTLFEVR